MPQDRPPLETTLITGVSSGLGNGLAHAYLERGGEVFGVSRREPTDLLRRDRFHFQTLDLQDVNQIGPQLKKLLADVDRLDLVILNAGILGEIKDLQETALSAIRRVMDVNVWANKLVLDHLFRSGTPIRQVVTISSGASVNGSRGWGAYSLSKATLNMLTRLYAREQPDTHFCALAPGPIDTAMQDYLCELQADDRYPSINVLKAKRNTIKMPAPRDAANRVSAAIEHLPDLVKSGDFADIRKPPLAQHGEPP
jgi:benzil reductase ((S)-benzoin forming)